MKWQSKIVHPRRKVSQKFESLAFPTYRGSTVVFASHEVVRDGWRDNVTDYSYGAYGTPTSLKLGARVAELEGAEHSFIVPSGQASISLIYLSLCSAGSHVLVPSTAYGPNTELGTGLLRGYQIEIELYDPLIGAEIQDRLRPETTLVWCESPSSITMEVQDVPAIVEAAHPKNVPVALDNTYAAGVLFDAFAHDVDVSMQALTKYAAGHSDVLLGLVSVRRQDLYERIGDTHRMLGMTASPDDCSLALRGLQTLGVRMKEMEQSSLRIAKWFATLNQIETVLHPALPSCGGHKHWVRDFEGASSGFSVVFAEHILPEAVIAFVNALQMFKIGWSWGGVTSLVMAYPHLERLGSRRGRLVRLHIGLEDGEDLIADLTKALGVMETSPASSNG